MLLLLASLLASSCQSTSDTSGAQTTQPSQTTGPSPSSQSTTSQPPDEIEVELGKGSFDLLDPRTGLDGLSSYNEVLEVAFQGTLDGQPQQWSMTYTFLHAREPLASVLTIDGSGDVVAPDPAVMAELGGLLYQSFGDGSCTANPIELENSPLALHEPARLLSGLLGAEEAGTEPANEVASLHYTFDERAMAESGRAETNGEVWVAVDGGHVLTYVRTTTADAAYFGGVMAGTMTWAYDLTEINQLPEIILPPSCQIDAPSMPDATNLQMLPSWMGFDTPSAVSEVTAFYLEQLPSRGWTPNGDPLIGDGTEVTVYAKGDELLNVIAIAGQPATRVDILLSTATE